MEPGQKAKSVVVNVMNDYELFVGAAAPNTYNLAPPLVCDLMQPNNSERLKRQFIGIPGGIHLGTTQSWIKSQLPTINYNCYKKTIKYNCKEIFVSL